MKGFLSRHGHAFVERHVDEDISAYDELIAHGWRTVPVTLIGRDAIKGFDEARLRERLASLGPPTRDR